MTANRGIHAHWHCICKSDGFSVEVDATVDGAGSRREEERFCRCTEVKEHQTHDCGAESNNISSKMAEGVNGGGERSTLMPSYIRDSSKPHIAALHLIFKVCFLLFSVEPPFLTALTTYQLERLIPLRRIEQHQKTSEMILCPIFHFLLNCLFLPALQLASLLAYTLLGFFLSTGSAFVTNFVIITVLLAVDFWVTKNVTGRMLVGLRYWNETHEDGSSSWKFESRADTLPEGSPTDNASLGINKTDSRVFWIALYTFPAAWALLSPLAVLKFDLHWLLVCAVGLAFSVPNAIGFTKCSADAKEKLNNLRQAARGLRSSFF